jgi:hypothetical protein
MGVIDSIKHDVLTRLRSEYQMSYEETMVKSGVIDPVRLDSIIAFKIVEVATDVMTWGKAHYKFPQKEMYNAIS